MRSDSPSEARERVLKVAEQMFNEQGYRAVTLRDLAAALQMQKASLYHHAPTGKEHLFIEVMERHLSYHQHALEAAIAEADPTLEARLTAAAGWFLSQPPINLTRLIRSDLTALAASNAEHVTTLAHRALLLPITHIFTDAGVTTPEPNLMAGAFVGMIESVHDARVYTDTSAATMMGELIAMILHGIQHH